MIKYKLIKSILSIGNFINSNLKSFFDLNFFIFFRYWQVQLSLIVIALLWTEFDYFKYKIGICLIYLVIYLYYQICLYLKNIYKKKLKFLLNNIKFLNRGLLLFYKITHIYIIYLYFFNVYYYFSKLVITFFTLFLKVKNCKIIIDFFFILFLFVQAVLLIIVDILLLLKEKLIKNTLIEILKWRLRSMFFSLCIIHVLVKYCGYVFFYVILLILCIKILLKFLELIFNKYINYYDKPLRFGSKFYLPTDYDFGYVDMNRFCRSKIFLELLEENQKKYNYEESFGLLIKYMLIDPYSYNGKYMENIYWYRPDYIYKNMFKVGLDMVTLMNFTFFLNTIIYNCMYLRNMLLIVEGKSKEEVKNILKTGYSNKENSFYHPTFGNNYFEDLICDYDIYSGFDKYELKVILNQWLELLYLCKDIMAFLKLEGKDIYELVYNINLDYIQNYNSLTIIEFIEIYINIEYKNHINLEEVNGIFHKKVINLQLKWLALEKKIRSSELYWLYVERCHMVEWEYNYLNFTHEKFLDLDLKTLKSENLNLYEKELLLLGLKNLKVKKKKDVVYF